MIKKAILPVAGLGTRFFPASKAIPKEMVTQGIMYGYKKGGQV